MTAVSRTIHATADTDRTEPAVDVVIVSYNSRRELRATVSELAEVGGVRTVVVDNASQDGTLDSVADLPVERIALGENRGFAAGCNAGWRAGRAPYVLFLNPDARIDEGSIRSLVGVLEADRRVGLVGPRILRPNGSLDLSQRRFHRLRTTYARALFVHRLLPSRPAVDDFVRDRGAYATSRACDWVSGACMLVRRDVLEATGGFDERFFLYCEDQDLCKRVSAEGYDVRFEPRATCIHEGGASAPRPSLFPVATRSGLLYAEKHSRGTTVVLERVGLLLHALTHTVLASGGAGARIGHLKTVPSLLRPVRGRIAP